MRSDISAGVLTRLPNGLTGGTMKGKKSILWELSVLLCVCVIAYALYSILMKYQEYKTAGVEYDELAEIAYQSDSTADPADVEQDNAGSTTVTTDIPAVYESPIDFAALQEINPDVIGWIVMDGTNIDYPIVQGRDNDSYLTTTYTGKANSSGAIFMDYRNMPDFTDANTIVYGHKMKNRTMFHDLSEYKSQEFFEDHPAFRIYTPNGEYRCEVFAAYVTSAVSESYALDFDGKANFVQYLNMAIEHSLIKTGTTLYSTDKIVTLSTCDYT